MGILKIVVSVNYSLVNYIKTYLLGDVNFEKTKDLCSYIITVPGGGIGPMTIAMLMLNTLKTYKI